MSDKSQEVYELLLDAIPDGVSSKDVAIALVLLVSGFALSFAQSGKRVPFIEAFAKDVLRVSGEMARDEVEEATEKAQLN